MSQDATARLGLISLSRDDGGHETDILWYRSSWDKCAFTNMQQRQL